MTRIPGVSIAMTLALVIGLILSVAATADLTATPESSFSESVGAEPDVTVTASVVTSDGVPIRNAYVGLIPEARPLRRPLVEEVALKGVTTFRVPPGNYWIIGGAHGFSNATLGPIEVTGPTAKVSIDLSRLTPATGRVTDESGKPIAGVQVSTPNAVIPPSVKLSPLLVQHLHADWSTTTGEDGTWSLPVYEGNASLLFDAPGRAMQWRVRPEGSTEAIEVTLKRGATLMVETDRSDADLIVTLTKEETKEDGAIPADQQALVWARRAGQRELDWSSLPAGTYKIMARYQEPGFFMQDAAELARVVLAPGEMRELRVTLPPVRHEAPEATALLVREISPAELGEGLTVFGRDAQGLGAKAESLAESVMGGTLVHVRRGTVDGPFYAMTKERFISPTPAQAGERIADASIVLASVRPRLDAHFELRPAEEGMELPVKGEAWQRDCDDDGDTAVPVEIEPNGVARFSGAVGCRHLTLRFEPYETIVRNTMIRSRTLDLGVFVLRAAAAADVRVVRGTDGEVVEGATVRVVTLDDDDQYPSPVVVDEAVTDDRGWAHLAGLPARRNLRAIAVTADGTMSDFATLELAPREKGVVDPLVVEEPATLIVDAKIDEAFREHYPSARILGLHLEPEDPYRRGERVQHDMVEGPVRFESLQPGRWLIAGTVGVLKSWSMFIVDDVELAAGETRHVTATILPNVYEGIVTSDGKPVVARIIVDDHGTMLYFNSDENGIFHIVLQSPGVYAVAATLMSTQGNQNPMGKIAFTDPSRRIELHLPKTASVTTRVRIGDQPVAARTTVMITRRGESGQVDRQTSRGRFTNADGETTFEDLAPGLWTFSVLESESHSGVEKWINVEEGENRTIDLDLEELAAIRGTVREVGGAPLSHATIDCLYVGPAGRLDRKVGVTDSDGGFAIDLIPPAPLSLLCSTIGQMGSVDATRMMPDESNEVTTAGTTATLLIPGWSAVRNPDAYWLVAPDGRVVGLGAVATKLGARRSPLSIPAIAAGRWKLVRVESQQDWLALANGLGASLPAVAEVTLRAGGTETIAAGAGE